VVEYYGASSEVAWLFLLAYWIAALIIVSFFYARWNWKRLYGELVLHGGEPGPDSPLEDLPEQLVRSGPLPAPVFEGDRLSIELGLRTRGAARGPARISGSVAGSELSGATGVVPRPGWSELRVVGPVGRGPVEARSWVLEAGDPLGLFRHRGRVADHEVALVLPQFRSLVSRFNVRELEASLAAPRSGAGTELFGVREYQPGDPLRRIHWRSSARHGQLVVREYEPPGVRTLGIFCDAEPPSREVADQIARLAASEAWDCIREGGRVVLWGPGLEPSAPDEARSFWALLEWLARFPASNPPLQGDAQGGGGSEPPSVTDAVGVLAGSRSAIVDALDDVRRRGGAVRAWVVGDEEVEVGGPLQRVGTDWPI
jgi:uncharacterized protein (DUF58 family)